MARFNASPDIPLGLTFDDVLLQPLASSVLPSQADTRTRLTRDIPLNIPLLSSAMDTGTEADMAIALAQLGGIGVLHRNLTVEDQAAAVRAVKRFESGMVVNPITMAPDQTLAEALELMKINRMSGIPMVRRSGKLCGILTNRDVRFAENPRQPVSELMTKDNLATVPLGTSQEEAQRILHQRRIEKLLVVDDDNHCVGLITVKDIEKSVAAPFATKDSEGRLRVAAATTVGAAGNIATADATEALIDSGADAIKVGIGPGSICTTRIVAGVGVPQLTAILDAVEAAKKADVSVIADGGIKYSGDLAKALAAGADIAMVGSLLAGTDETPGEVFLWQGRSYKAYRGMGSVGAMARGSADRYFQQDIKDTLKLVPEGIEGQVPYKGPVGNVMHQLAGGLRAAMGYVGARNLAEFHAKAQFVRITRAGSRDNHGNNARQSPNYRGCDRRSPGQPNDVIARSVSDDSIFPLARMDCFATLAMT